MIKLIHFLFRTFIRTFNTNDVSKLCCPHSRIHTKKKLVTTDILQYQFLVNLKMGTVEPQNIMVLNFSNKGKCVANSVSVACCFQGCLFKYDPAKPCMTAQPYLWTRQTSAHVYFIVQGERITNYPNGCSTSDLWEFVLYNSVSDRALVKSIPFVQTCYKSDVSIYALSTKIIVALPHLISEKCACPNVLCWNFL